MVSAVMTDASAARAAVTSTTRSTSSTPSRAERVDFAVDSRWYDAAGDLFSEQSMDAWFEADWTSSAHAAGYGWDEPGKWTAGEYRVELLISGQPVISGTFEIR